MDFKITDSPHIKKVVEQITSICEPEKIYLFSSKNDLSGEITSFKICVIIDTDNKANLEHNMYIDIDFDIPFDVLIYTPKEWEEISKRAFSFASQILKTGMLIYG